MKLMLLLVLGFVLVVIVVFKYPSKSLNFVIGKIY